MSASRLTVGFVASLFIFFVTDWFLRARKKSNRPPLPPGPKGLPLVGNMNDLPRPTEFGAHHWLKHRDLYGPISSITVMGQTLVIINDPLIAFEILEKRSSEFSSRSSLVFAGELVGWKYATGGLEYNDTLRLHRKAFARILGTKATAARYDTLQEAEVGHFLLHVLDNPQKLTEHIAKEAGSVILNITYGYNTEQFQKDPLLSKMNEATEHFAYAATPGAFLVDTFPMLRYVPEWFPGASWKKLAKKWAFELRDTVETSYKFVEDQLAEGKPPASYLSHAIESSKNTPEDLHNNKWTAASLFSGGSDTSVASIAVFFLAMAKFPDVQKKAQEEIDRVIGKERLPNLHDCEKLPYIEAVVTEVLRWHPIGPMGLPHASSEDAVYGGFWIPKDSYLMPNIWWFAHDPEVYKDPMEFRPERFLEGPKGRKPEPDPRKYVFGFGRRVCAGKNLAENSLFLNFAQSLAVFNIDKPVVDGKVVEPKTEFLPGVVSHPAPFNVSIKPRSDHHEKLIRAIEQRFPWKESDAKYLKPISE
ncbi:Multifunctional cytochrome P450 monooxygenase [Colletotrichum orbiculare MAFF 240422]|uniref:Multifunctional cytochrome P450 monooxygenase n=1 Tax=Colletotrichum orbiculare (strain 104-T / ATCC 96160 / CBS 514.97 / LARS 414 / MAFF 240422) TaxID=1213857 RepID=A0A484F9N2_COLOR|nr:Multifunctional cytochrome P450 monooxygenase [Colletotrichum orbiculare MAFF 240422]